MSKFQITVLALLGSIACVVLVGVGFVAFTMLQPNEQVAGQPAQHSEPTPTPEPINQAKQKWQEHNISNYHIVVVSKSIWHNHTYRITVKNGEVVEQSATCIHGAMESRLDECEIPPFNADDYTVPGIFALTESLEWIEVTFNPQYGFPQKISHDVPDTIDEEFTLQVDVFEVLE